MNINEPKKGDFVRSGGSFHNWFVRELLNVFGSEWYINEISDRIIVLHKCGTASKTKTILKENLKEFYSDAGPTPYY